MDSLYYRRTALVLATTSGVLYFVGFCGFDQAYLAWICLVPVMWALDDVSLGWGEALLIAWTFGLVTHLGGYTWITGMLHDFGHLPIPLALAGYFLLCLGQGSLLAAWGWSLNRVVTSLKLPMIWAAPVLMVLAEWLWPALFPSYLSNSQYRQVLFIQTLDLWGPLGLTFIVALASAVVYQTLAWWLRQRGHFPRLGWVTLILLVIGDIIYGVGSIADVDDTVGLTDRRLNIGIVQVNMGIYQKDDDPAEGARRHLNQSLEVADQGADLIVWPEAGYNYAIRTSMKNVKHIMGELDTPILFGAIRLDDGDDERRMYNSAFLADGDGHVRGTYDKIFLLAFGEYLPLGDWFPSLYDLSLFRHTSRFYRGIHTESLVLDQIRYGVLICYEDILPGFVRRVMEGEPHVLVNLTNDAWFGRSREPTIHLALAAFRAVEHRRYLVRATNTGISAFIDPAGRILEQTAIFERANRVLPVTPLEGRTLYGRFGDWVGMVCAMVLLWWLRGWFRELGGRILRRIRGSPMAPSEQSDAQEKQGEPGGEASDGESDGQPC
ncbi:apolipoprotein N-acyltransferase [Myxococcota bacterium]